MNIEEAEKWLRQELAFLYDASEATNIASMAMEHITGLTKINRVSRKHQPLLVQQLHRLTQIHQRLLQHEPIQYVLEEAWFYGMKLFVDKSVLIPRPETEELVEWIIQDVQKSGKDVFEKRPSEADKTTQLKILDVGTGSGCIALALKKLMQGAEVWGCDISDDALNVARRNGSELDIRVDFISLDFLDEAQYRQLPTVDIIVSNPPYIPLSEKQKMQNNVVAYEPHTALFVPDHHALLFYEALARFGKSRLHDDGSIYAEIHEDLAMEVVQAFEAEGYASIEIRKDMQGKDRLVKARKVT